MTKRANKEVSNLRPKRLTDRKSNKTIKKSASTKNKQNTLKKTALRNNEYYDFQRVQDKLYMQSKEGRTFNQLLDLVKSYNNLMLAFRNIKTNKGSHTAGVNKNTIEYWEQKPVGEYIEYMRNRIDYYMPMAVRRVEIPKPNGKMRPLGIPTIEDRLIQQAIKQVLEPICEAKFHNNSYGFRPNRSTEHAVANFVRIVNLQHCHYVVDIDIEGFFDNVSHGKLLKQMWTMGIRDKNLLKIISKMLKAEIKGIGIPTKGTPQGGILSPLLSNIVLNELDWWIESQWSSMKTRHNYDIIRKNGIDKSDKYRALRKTKLKEIYIVRYADDFKILCKDRKTAQNTFCATKLWLKERLQLNISKEKSQVTNLRKRYSEFLGFTFKAFPKKHKYIVQSHICEKAKAKILKSLQNTVVELKKHPTVQTVGLYNSKILGIQNYYKIATMVNIDLAKIAYLLSRKLRNRIKSIENKTGYVSKLYRQRYKNNYKIHYVAKTALFPIQDIQHKNPMNFNKEVCNYTEMGRKRIHNIAYVNCRILKQLMLYPDYGQSALFNDNRISLYAGQAGKCALTGDLLEIGKMEVHHITPRKYGGNDKYQNLVYLTKNAHALIHYGELSIGANKELRDLLNSLDDRALKKLQEYRRLAEMPLISYVAN